MPRGSREQGPPPPATQDADQIHKLMQKKIAQLTKVVYHVNTTNEDHQSELAALKKAIQGLVVMDADLEALAVALGSGAARA